MKLTRKQTATLERLTDSITRACTSSVNPERWLSGPVAYSLVPWGEKEVALVASNATDEMRWFHSRVYVLVVVGPNGGRRIKHHDGVGLGWLR